jgi:beta-lactamase superfamily II metal-dependent hydrolase
LNLSWSFKGWFLYLLGKLKNLEQPKEIIKMEIKIFDVTHGFCAYLIADNMNVMLFDCGHNERTGFRPSEYLPRNNCTGIEHLIISNFDQDHVSDLSNLIGTGLPIEVFFRNGSVSADQLTALKQESGPITASMQAAIDLHAAYDGDVTNPPEFPDIELKCFGNKYPLFTATNNLSLVSFVHYDGMGIIFPGDLEKEGWSMLLCNSLFCRHLQRVNIFIASHHGRENGYCEDVFEYCSPDIVIISDKEIVHETQKNNYKKHASGILWNQEPEKRYVLTTRSDGMITITKKLREPYNITI